jgi:hypothetical protein
LYKTDFFSHLSINLMENKYPSIEYYKNSKRDWKTGNNWKWHIEEKLDGSQLSFTVDIENNFNFYCKGSLIKETNKTFLKSMNLLKLNLKNCNPNFIYHGEAICNLQHNVVKYLRIPKNYFVLYDIYDYVNKCWLNLDFVSKIGNELGLETVQILFKNENPDNDPFTVCKQLLHQISIGNIDSMLGPGELEGIILKHHSFIGRNGISATKLKMVSDKFKETHGTPLNKEKPTIETALESLAQIYNNTNRFQKAFQHVRDQEQLKGNDSDLFKIKEEFDNDLEKECSQEIKEYLWAELAPFVKRICRKDLDTWWNNKTEKF